MHWSKCPIFFAFVQYIDEDLKQHGVKESIMTFLSHRSDSGTLHIAIILQMLQQRTNTFTHLICLLRISNATFPNDVVYDLLKAHNQLQALSALKRGLSRTITPPLRTSLLPCKKYVKLLGLSASMNARSKGCSGCRAFRVSAAGPTWIWTLEASPACSKLAFATYVVVERIKVSDGVLYGEHRDARTYVGVFLL